MCFKPFRNLLVCVCGGRVYHPYEPEYLAALKRARVKELKSRAFAKDFATYLVFLVAIAIISQQNRDSFSFTLKHQVERTFVTGLGLDMVRFFSYFLLSCIVKKEIRCSEDSEILHEIVCETIRISSSFNDFLVVSRTILHSTVSRNPRYT